jgi:hypothetical protein
VWVKLDDKLPDNPKIDRLSDGAFRLYVSSLCHCGSHLTDGWIEKNRVSRLIPQFKKSYIAELLTKRPEEEYALWEDHGDRYLIHDFTQFNKTRAHWKDKRAADNERLKEWRQKKQEPRGHLEAL